MLAIAPDRLLQIGTAIFTAAGTPPDIAAELTRSLVDANLAGHDSHGVLRIPQYLEEIETGKVRPAERPTILREGPTTALVDGRSAFGQITARFAMNLAIERARQVQVAVVSTVRTNHIGRLGEWSELAANAGLIGMVATAWGSGPFAAAPYGGAARALSTNPISFGLPMGSRPPLILDYATTAVAEGKLRFARAKGAQLPPGCILDKDGNPSTDPNDFYNGGMMLPFAGHKGFALAMVVELLSIALSGADVITDGRVNGAFFLAIDPRAFRPFEEYLATAEAIAQRIKSVPPAPGFSEVLLPGEPEARSRAARQRAIEVPEATWEALEAAARRVGVTISAGGPAALS